MSVLLSRFAFWITRWRISGRIPTEPKYIMAFGPHTSNWDFPLGIIARQIIGHNIKFLAKASLFRKPFGWFFRYTGGYPVDRSKKEGWVKTMVQTFNEHEEFRFIIAGEGTRSKVDRLKTGFYYIAKEAKIPIIPVAFDYPSRQVILGDPFWPDPAGDVEGDLEKLVKWYGQYTGKNPENGIGWVGLKENHPPAS